MLWATVTAISPLTVKVDGASTAAPAYRIGSYTPVAGDRVRVEQAGSQLIVHGKVVS